MGIPSIIISPLLSYSPLALPLSCILRRQKTRHFLQPGIPDLETKKYKSVVSQRNLQMCSWKTKPSFFIGLHLDKEASPSVLAKGGKLCCMQKPEPSRLHFAAGMEQLHMSTAEEADGERRVDRWMGKSQGVEQFLKGHVRLLCQPHRNHRQHMQSNELEFLFRGWKYPQPLSNEIDKTFSFGKFLFTSPVYKIYLLVQENSEKPILVLNSCSIFFLMSIRLKSKHTFPKGRRITMPICSKAC